MTDIVERLRDYGLTLDENVVICDRRVVDEAADIINQLIKERDDYKADYFLRHDEAASQEVSEQCKQGCQYAKDVGMQEYHCILRCQYLDRLPKKMMNTFADSAYEESSP